MIVSILFNIIIIAVIIRLIATRYAGRLTQSQHVLFCATAIILFYLAIILNLKSAYISGAVLLFTYALIGLDEQMKRLQIPLWFVLAIVFIILFATFYVVNSELHIIDNLFLK